MTFEKLYLEAAELAGKLANAHHNFAIESLNNQNYERAKHHIRKAEDFKKLAKEYEVEAGNWQGDF